MTVSQALKPISGALYLMPYLMPSNSRDDMGRTALHWAAAEGLTEVARELLIAGQQQTAEMAEGAEDLPEAPPTLVDFQVCSEGPEDVVKDLDPNMPYVITGPDLFVLTVWAKALMAFSHSW